MHPLSVIPQILFLGAGLSPLLLRIASGLFILSTGWERRGKSYGWTSVIYGLSGLFLILGFYTQVAVIISVIVLIFDYFVDGKISGVSKDKMFVYILADVILLSLAFTGPGFFALDLPL